MIAITSTLAWVYCTFDYGIDFFFYYSNWASTMAVITFWLLTFAHGRTHLEDFQRVAIEMFEVVLAMEYLINVLYWKLLYDPNMINFNDFTTLRGPFLNHLMPFIFLNLEMILNGFTFDFSSNFRHFIKLVFVYLFMNLLGSIYLGSPVYYFLRFDELKTILVIAVILVIQISIYICLSIVNNHVLKKNVVLKTQPEKEKM